MPIENKIPTFNAEMRDTQNLEFNAPKITGESDEDLPTDRGSNSGTILKGGFNDPQEL